MKRIFLILVMLLALVSNAWAITSKAVTGNLSDPTNWVGDVAPVDGDIPTIVAGADITVDIPIIFGADGGQYAFAAYVLAGGTLRVSDDLTIRGDLVQQRGSYVEITASGSLTFDSDSAGVYRMWRTVSSGSGTTTFKISGTEGSHVPISSDNTRGGRNGVIWQTDSDYTDFDFQNVKFTRIGDATYRAIQFDIGTDHTSNFSNLIFVECGEVLHKLTDGTSSVVWDAIDFRSSTSAPYTIQDGGAKTTGTRLLTNITSYMEGSADSGVIYSDDVVVQNVHGFNSGISQGYFTSGHRLSVDGALMVADIGGFVSPTGHSQANLTNMVFLSSADNTHYCNENEYIAAEGKNYYSNVVFDGNDTTTQTNDGILVGGEVDVRNCISLNKGGIIANAITTQAIVTIENCTVLGNGIHTGQDTALLSLGENYGSATQGLLCRNNLMVGTVESVFQHNMFVAQTNFTLDYNGSFDNGYAPNLDYPTGHPHAGENSYASQAIGNFWNPAETFGSDNATNDIVADPEFVDDTVSVLAYIGEADILSAGREIVKLNGVDYLGNLVTPTDKNVTDALAYIQAGLTPTNQIYANAASDGGDIGAVAVQEEQTPPTTTTQNIFRLGGGAGISAGGITLGGGAGLQFFSPGQAVAAVDYSAFALNADYTTLSTADRVTTQTLTAINSAGAVGYNGATAGENEALLDSELGMQTGGEFQNELLWTEGLTNAIWLSSQVSVVSTTIEAPDGSNTAIHLSGSGTASYFGQQFIHSTGDNTISMWVKSAGLGNDTYRLFMNANTASSNKTAPAEWGFVEFTADVPLSADNIAGIARDLLNNDWDIYIWHPNFNPGSYAKPYSKNEGSIIVRPTRSPGGTGEELNYNIGYDDPDIDSDTWETVGEAVFEDDFTVDVSDWAVGTGAAKSWVTGRVLVEAGSIYGIYQEIPTVAGESYKVVADMQNIDGDLISVRATESGGFTTIAESQGFSDTSEHTDIAFNFTATGAATRIYLRVGGSGNTGYFDNISIKKIQPSTSWTTMGQNLLNAFDGVADGGEKVTNGGFDTGDTTGWTGLLNGGSAVVSGGELTLTAGAGGALLFYQDILTLGNTYEMSFDLKDYSGTNIAIIDNGGTPLYDIDQSDIKDDIAFRFVHSNADGRIFYRVQGDGDYCTIDNVSVKQVSDAQGQIEIPAWTPAFSTADVSGVINILTADDGTTIILSYDADTSQLKATDGTNTATVPLTVVSGAGYNIKVQYSAAGLRVGVDDVFGSYVTFTGRFPVGAKLSFAWDEAEWQAFDGIIIYKEIP